MNASLRTLRSEMRVLENDHAVLERDGGGLVLAGVTDLSASHSPHLAPDLAAALKGAPKDAAVILLDHQPRGRSAWRCS
jgi:predicted MPP superfamily phosphohydrolase